MNEILKNELTSICKPDMRKMIKHFERTQNRHEQMQGSPLFLNSTSHYPQLYQVLPKLIYKLNVILK